MTVRTWVGRFCVVDGRVEEEGAWLGSLIRQRPDDDPDELYILIEPVSETGSEYAAQLVDVIARLYGKDPLSLTGALQRSLRAAHDHLRDWNRRSLKEHRVGAGAGCIALRGTDAYLAQAGPVVAYVRAGAPNADGSVRRIEAEHTDFEHTLGVADTFEPRITRIALQPGDLMLVASSAIDRIAPAEHVARILGAGADEALPELYRLCRDEPNMSVLLLSCFEPDPAQVPAFLSRDGDQRDAAATVMAPPPEDAISDNALQPVGAATGPEPAMATLATGAFDAPQRPAHERVREISQETAPSPMTGVRIRDGNAQKRYRTNGKTGTGPGRQFEVPKLAVFAALALLVVGLVAYWQFPDSVQDSREERFTALIAGARESNAQAQATADRGLKRQLLTSAQGNLTDAAKIHADNGELLALNADVTQAMNELDAIYDVKEFTPIVDLAQQVTGALSVSHTVIGGDSAYLLDAKGHRVLRVSLDGSSAPETIIEEGGTAGVVTVARPAQIAWSPETEALIVLDEQRQPFAYFPAQSNALPITVRGTDGWGSLNAIAAASGNLYLLDVEGAQVWRYLPGQGGFDSERTGLLDAPDLSDATEIAVGKDVFVLDSELGIRRFIGRTETPFPLAGIDRPLMSPASLSVLPGSNRLVVADRGNKRIVVVSDEGAFLRQIVSASFTDLRAAVVDEGTSTLYVLNGDTLMKAPFPP